ncbi:DUF6356 family protein [Parerythrobacter jejuensis]|uniref:Capsule biosynthesis protein n=1 Tax=Parerythrobacter jejuensis TaxID=795812 RepID=A0A845ALT2_9SPHN|nr:DUF6356 family protein [Parerythrobacter jejuensis]MXP30377.1 hypothetical protein [Parerythrobacter jejuensis]MXP33137.1 hypothetical protein [Parerythrobacter jejuensis]
MNIFTDHPRSVGETYTEHFRVASSFGIPMIGGGIACLLHGAFPFLFRNTGSTIVRKLHARMVANRVRPERSSQKGQQLDWCI